MIVNLMDAKIIVRNVEKSGRDEVAKILAAEPGYELDEANEFIDASIACVNSMNTCIKNEKDLKDEH